MTFEDHAAAVVGLRGPDTIRVVIVSTAVEVAIPLSGVFEFFGGTAPTVWTYSVDDSARVYSQ